MIATFPSIKFGLMVGIGGGIPPKVRLGDVVVSTPTDHSPGVVQWDLGKAEEGSKFRRTGALNNPPSALLTALALLKTEHEMNGPNIPQYLNDLKKNWPRLVPKYIRSESLEDVLFRPDYGHVSESSTDRGTIPENEGGEDEERSCRFCDRTKIIKRKSRDMLVHYGIIASGNQVIKDATFRDKLNKDLGGNILCVEMEAAGLMNDFPCIVIRGICDYADSHKNKDWQEHAAAVAAAFAKELLEYVQPSDLERERTAKEILGRVLDAVSTTGANVENLKSKWDKDEDTKILNWLTTIDYGAQQSDYFRRRQPGTGQWLLDSPQYRVWLETSKQTLFCPGIPGAGKTILTSVVIDDLITRFSVDQNIGIAYLYCNFRHRKEQQAEDFLASLLGQLSQEKSPVPDSVKELYDRHKGKRTRPSFDEISRALHSVAAIYSRVFIVVDALDECQASDGCRARFITELFSLQAKCKANLFMTSRFITEITEKFDGNTSLKIRASGNDIRVYLDGYMLNLPSFLRSPELREEVKNSIVKAADGMFLLAQLYANSLKDKITVKAIKTALKQFQKQTQGSSEDHRIKTLAEAYHQTMERIEGQETGFRQLAENVLLWITCAKRPLTTSELQQALAVEVGSSELDTENIPQVKDMVSACAGLVTVDEDSRIIRLVHNTTQEYFERTQKDWFPNADTEITRVCTTYLSFEVFGSGFCKTDEQFEERLLSNPLYDYAAHNWGHHALKVSTLCQEVMHFLECDSKVEASSQALMAAKRHSWHSNYSQEAPRQVSRMHLAAYFGVQGAVATLLGGDCVDLNDSYGRTPLSWATERGHEAVVKLLLERGADLESKDNIGRTTLSWATEGGHEAVVKLLLEKGADLKSKDNIGRTSLLWAVKNGHEAVVKLLLQKGTGMESNDKEYDQKQLLLAAEKGYEEFVKRLLEKGADLESKDNIGRTPLSWATGGGREAVVKLLLEKGADLESKDNIGRTPLSWVTGGGHEAIVKLLLKKGADLESKDNIGRTPLSWATGRGHEAVVRLLLRKGADLESKDNIGQTPLLWAVKNGHEAAVKLMLENGADMESKDYSGGRTPLSWAAENGHEAVVKLLLEKGADLESKDDHSRTPLSWASENGHKTVVKLLLEKGTDLESEDNICRTPLLWATGKGHTAVVKLLLEKGADLESKDNIGRTPLLWAVKNGHEAVVELLLQKGTDMESNDKEYDQKQLLLAAEKGYEKFAKRLLEKGADLECKDYYSGRTPLSWAAENGHEAVVKLLLEKGADLGSKDKKYSRTPLSWAAWNRQEAVIRLLLEKSTDMESKHKEYGQMLLSCATENEH